MWTELLCGFVIGPMGSGRWGHDVNAVVGGSSGCKCGGASGREKRVLKNCSVQLV